MSQPKCRFCDGVEGPFKTTQDRVGIRRGSTSYRMKTYYHHAACAEAFEAKCQQDRLDATARLEAWGAEIGVVR